MTCLILNSQFSILKESTAPISRVLFWPKPAPAIYLLRTSRYVSSVLPSIVESGGQPSDDGLHELAASRWNSPSITRRLVVSYTTFSPLPASGRLFSSSISSCRQLLLLSEVECPVLPGLSSRRFLSFFMKKKRSSNQRQAEAVLSSCKSTNFYLN